MKDGNDTQTPDLISEPRKKRGRPSSGNAMTPAERKRKSRAEAKLKAEAAAHGIKAAGTKINEVPITGLIEVLQKIMANPKKNKEGKAAIRNIMAELERRYELK